MKKKTKEMKTSRKKVLEIGLVNPNQKMVRKVGLMLRGDSCASDKPGEGIPKCVSSAKEEYVQKERLAAVPKKKILVNRKRQVHQNPPMSRLMGRQKRRRRTSRCIR